MGEKGMAQERLDPRGMVQVRGELWQAEAEPSGTHIEPNSEIKVTAAQGLTLIVSREINAGKRAITKEWCVNDPIDN